MYGYWELVMRFSLRHSCFLVLLILLLASCSSTKFVGEGEYLLDKVSTRTETPLDRQYDLRSYLRQQPNFKIFGLMKWQLFVYGWSGHDEKKWINRQLRKLGEPPVIMDTLLVDQSATELQRFLVNKGYVNARVSYSIDTSRYKKARVYYDIIPNAPYRIRNYEVALDDPVVDSIAHLKPPVRSRFKSAFRPSLDEYVSLVEEGSLFDRDMLDEERERIADLLRKHGYYAFNRNHLAYLADSAFQRNIVDLEMTLRPFRQVDPDGSTHDVPHKPYYINSVKIYTDYDALSQANGEAYVVTDSVARGGMRIYYGKSGRSLRPNTLFRSAYIQPGQLYNEENVEQTYSAFASLRALRNVNIRFDEFEENDTMKLDCSIQTAPSKRYSVGVDLEGTNSAGDLGFASSLSFQHRNLFKGSEVFTATVRGAYESLSGGREYGLADNYWELGAEGSMLFPKFLFPFLSADFRRKSRASTEVKVSYNLQTRPEYTRAILSGGWSYIWQDRLNTQARHTFRLVDLNYVYLPKVQEAFISDLPDYMLLYNYTDHFIMASGYTYSFSNSSPQKRMRNTHSIRASVEIAGNLLSAFSLLTGARKNENGVYELFGTEYAQYAKFDFDYSQGIVLDNRNRLAFHVGVGVGLPYGNSDYLPFERVYFSGGANSVRGWSVRELGPGSMRVTDSTSFALQSGDIRLDLSIEYRTKLFWKFELAAYIDAGNVWTTKKLENQKDGNFDFSRFYKEIVVSYGLGLRLDFDFFLLRFDTGMKAYNPQERGSRRWAITRPNFKDNFAWHFAVGYPF